MVVTDGRWNTASFNIDYCYHYYYYYYYIKFLIGVIEDYYYLVCNWRLFRLATKVFSISIDKMGNSCTSVVSNKYCIKMPLFVLSCSSNTASRCPNSNSNVHQILRQDAPIRTLMHLKYCIKMPQFVLTYTSNTASRWPISYSHAPQILQQGALIRTLIHLKYCSKVP